jgi:ribosomal protein S12 methylthiotransferase
MGRNTSRDDLYRMIERIRSRVPDAAVRTTVIVGFPGETETEFRQLLTFIEDIQFTHLGCFIYSDAEDLPSHRLSGHVSYQVGEERYDEVMTLQRRIVGRLNEKYLGNTLPVLIEEKSESGLYVGRTEFQAPEVDGVTFVRAGDLSVGQFAATRINEVLEYDLVGEAH